MGKSQRTKGAAFERAVATMLREAMPGADVKRGWQTRKGDDDPDVLAPGLSIECKHRIRPNVRAALLQGMANANAGTWAVAVCRWSGARAPGATIVAMDADDWLDLLREWWELKNR